MTEPATLTAAELADLRATVAQIARGAGSMAFARSLEHPGDADHDTKTWQLLAHEVGLAGLALPESAGGVGGLVELLAVAEELGRELVAVPLLSSTVMAGQVLARCPGSVARQALERICAGEIGTVALADPSGRPDPTGVAYLVAAPGSEAENRSGATPAAAGEAPPAGAQVHLSGTIHHVPDGASAELLVVTVRSAEGLQLALLDDAALNGEAAIERRPQRVMDFTRPQATLHLNAAPAIMLTSGTVGAQALSGALDIALLALSADQLGGLRRAFELTLEYVKTRRQFNRAIGSFQAIKFRLADLLAQVELARTALERVTLAPLPPDELAKAAAIATIWCREAYLAMTAEMVQLHGGIGFTWEHDAHLFVRRARADAALWGDATFHRERLAHLANW